jgi:hypothetical protein
VNWNGINFWSIVLDIWRSGILCSPLRIVLWRVRGSVTNNCRFLVLIVGFVWRY